jgi:hypothetical protein
MTNEVCFTLHVKVLTKPFISVANMVRAMRELLDPNGIRVIVGSNEILDLPLLTDLDIGTCTGSDVTPEQIALFQHRTNAKPDDIIAYFVRSTYPPTSGCAAHPEPLPSAVVTYGASRWSLAHEIGHVLGLRHVDDNRRLMTGDGTLDIVDPPPGLVASELRKIRKSPLVKPYAGA